MTGFLLATLIGAGSFFSLHPLHLPDLKFTLKPVKPNSIGETPKLLPEQPDHIEQSDAEALQFFRAKNYPGALEKYGILLKSHPKNSVILNNIGLTYLKLNDFKNAERVFQESLTIAPKDAAIYNNLASLKLAQNNSEEAINYLYQAILYQPEMTEAHLNLAKAFELAGRSSESIPEYQYYLNHSPNERDPTIRRLIEKRIVKLKSFVRLSEHAD